ncbi:nuclear transport factor 2 family protein [Mesorhizobium retamae]|uniref:Nuclear transport factor 2 family protein n=1 Tax=Mesorhizobium retamae TaxID=2912854 RepID=A0ABS9QA48_9HYPH|nr:nuclear transport factor 2 family protein [Mesorhizobium sp. IRAMC:0171]
MPVVGSSKLYAVIIFALTLDSARAEDHAVIGRWYSALLVADRGSLSDMLADDARIRLQDVDTEQNKQQFLASMDEWKGAVAGANIRHRIESADNGLVTVVVCYDFPGNDLMTREVFALTDERITASSQATIAENCDGF